jgi:hypothetical protein
MTGPHGVNFCFTLGLVRRWALRCMDFGSDAEWYRLYVQAGPAFLLWSWARD